MHSGYLLTMPKLAFGPAPAHTLESYGPENLAVQFYSTTYSTNYGGKNVKSCGKLNNILACHK